MTASVAAGGSPAGFMLVTNKLQAAPSGGREMLCKLNHDALMDLYGSRLVVVELEKRPVRAMASVAAAFRGYLDGLDSRAIDVILQKIESAGISRVFIDGSNFGQVAKAVKARFPAVQTITFFHNVEARFFWGSLKRSRSIHALAVLAVNYLAERKSVRHSDRIICLSGRDSRLISRLYGRAATDLSPMALQDRAPNERNWRGQDSREDFALFVGGVFYANRDGIAWYVENVVPHIRIKTVVVGKGFEAMKAQLERPGKVEVVGAVVSLADWYRDARFVIAPIFDGSGMKTKVAEALMHGKRIVGTPEAFSGYEDISAKAGWVCATAVDFVEAIAAAQYEPALMFRPELRALYEEKYSFDAARTRLAGILEPIGSGFK